MFVWIRLEAQDEWVGESVLEPNFCVLIEAKEEGGPWTGIKMMMMMMFSHLTLRYESENPRIFKDSQESLSNASFMKELLSITFLKDDHSLFTEISMSAHWNPVQK